MVWAGHNPNFRSRRWVRINKSVITARRAFKYESSIVNLLDESILSP